MSYGQGDYGQGDYGQGDPGLFSFLGKIGKAALGFIPGGSVVSGAIDAVGGLLHHSSPTVHLQGSGGGSIMTLATAPGFTHPQVTQTHTSVGYGLFDTQTSYAGGGGGGRGGAPGQAGYHQIRSGRNAGKWVRNRRMNITNPKALRRAIRRGHGFEKMARRMLGFATPHKPKGRMYFRKTTRKK
jgi:hypothetical protein